MQKLCFLLITGIIFISPIYAHNEDVLLELIQELQKKVQILERTSLPIIFYEDFDRYGLDAELNGIGGWHRMSAPNYPALSIGMSSVFGSQVASPLAKPGWAIPIEKVREPEVNAVTVSLHDLPKLKTNTAYVLSVDAYAIHSSGGGKILFHNKAYPQILVGWECNKNEWELYSSIGDDQKPQAIFKGLKGKDHPVGF